MQPVEESAPNVVPPQSERDLLVSRPGDPLRWVEEPRGPHSLGYPADPKPDPEERDDAYAFDIGYTA
jgi:hypothetical protein